MMIDLRSDTVTQPTPAMLEAMQNASVGDDVFGEDPTVNALEQKAAGMFGKEAALFCPSGTMTNQIAIKVHTEPGDEVVCSALAHIYQYEGGGIAFNSGCSVRLIRSEDGIFTARDVEEQLNADDPHFPVTKLVAVENTCNKGGGTIWKFDKMKAICDRAHQLGLKTHLDGARFFNAHAEEQYDLKMVGNLFDSISICLSKGLGAPVGSLLIGDERFVKKARRVRKVFGGGMRQAGYLAAAGIFALDNNIKRLKEDHARARRLAEVLQDCSFVSRTLPVSTNIVVAELAEGKNNEEILDRLKQNKILAVPFGNQRIRMVTHLDLDDDKFDRLLSILKSLD